MSITRRGLLAGIFASVTAPAIVRASSLMPIVAPKIILPKHFSWDPDLIIIRSNQKYLDEPIRNLAVKGLTTDFDGDAVKGFIALGDLRYRNGIRLNQCST